MHNFCMWLFFKSDDFDFFWNLLKDLNDHYGVILGAIATLILAFVAVFQKKIFYYLNKPKIRLKSINFPVLSVVFPVLSVVTTDSKKSCQSCKSQKSKFSRSVSCYN